MSTLQKESEHKSREQYINQAKSLLVKLKNRTIRIYLYTGILFLVLFPINKIISEVALLVLLVLVSINLFIDNRKTDKGKERNNSVLIAILLLIAFFVLLHFLFCYQLGYPASSSQERSDLVLKSSDWLVFLGSYLSFAGSLVMAYFVYRQSKVLNDFTISEYSPSIGIKIVECRIIEKNDRASILQKDKGNKDYYTFFPPFDFDRNQYDGSLEDFGILLFSEITNYSKSTLHEFTLERIEIEEQSEFGDGEIGKSLLHVYYGTNLESLDPKNVKTALYPKSSLNWCFALWDVPKQFNISLMKIVFSFSNKAHLAIEKESREVRVLVQKKQNEQMQFVNI